MIVEVNKQSEWDNYLKQISNSVFLLDWWWGEFQKSTGCIPHRLVWTQDGRTRAAAQIFFQLFARRIGYGTIARAPVFAADTCKEERAYIEDSLAKWCAGKHCAEHWIFWRFEPLHEAAMEPAGARIIRNRQPQTTLILDILKSPDELLDAMHEKTRYNVRLSLKKELTYQIASAADVSERAFSAFWNLMTETSKRAGIRNHGKFYYWQLFETAFRESVPHVYLAIIEKNNIASAAGVYIGSGGTLTYLYGASSNRDRNTMAPYFMHWQTILYARKHGFVRYDWWGVNPEDTEHPEYKKSWEGITRFKKGFGGVQVSYPRAREIPIDAVKYKVYQYIQSCRKALLF